MLKRRIQNLRRTSKKERGRGENKKRGGIEKMERASGGENKKRGGRNRERSSTQ